MTKNSEHVNRSLHDHILFTYENFLVKLANISSFFQVFRGWRSSLRRKRRYSIIFGSSFSLGKARGSLSTEVTVLDQEIAASSSNLINENRSNEQKECFSTRKCSYWMLHWYYYNLIKFNWIASVLEFKFPFVLAVIEIYVCYRVYS